MTRVLFGVFIVAHGLLTAFIWLSPPRQMLHSAPPTPG
jgi:hypothetical protein